MYNTAKQITMYNSVIKILEAEFKNNYSIQDLKGNLLSIKIIKPVDNLINKINKLFNECDYFKLYDVFIIDIDKQ